MAKIQKAKYWTAVLYPESMIENWPDLLPDIVQVSYCYCVHDKDSLAAEKTFKNKYGKDVTYSFTEEHDERKVHVHIILAFNNTTTYNHVLGIFQKLMPSCKYCEQVLNIRYLYEYLIHNTETAKKQKKHLYDISERICGNNFDIGSYEQLSLTDKNEMSKTLADFIINNHIDNYTDFYIAVLHNYDSSYFEIVRTYSGFYERLCKGNYLNASRGR